MSQPHNLTEKQQKFVLEYIKNGYNLYQAAKKAGYSEYSADSGALARALLDNPKIKAKIESAQAKSEMRAIVTFDWKVKQLLDIIETHRARGLAMDSAVVIKAIDLLNKMQGDYAPDKVYRLTVKATADKLKEAQKQYEQY